MKKKKEEIPLAYFERSYVVLTVFLGVTALLIYLSYHWIAAFNPFGVVTAIPASFLVLQCLWLILNPYAIIYEDKFEIKKSLFSTKFWYYIDLKKVGESTPRGFSINYNDDDLEKISDFGIRPSHKKPFRDAVNHHVCKSLVERED